MTQQEFILPRVYAPVVTPFNRDYSVDAGKFIAFCKWLISQRAGLAIFGTNSEANSLSFQERLALLDLIVDAKVDPRYLMPGTGSSALPEAILLTKKAVELGCGGTLVLPPFYYKGVSDEGVFRYYSEIIQATGSEKLKLFLYHIPQLSGVPITLPLIERLRKEYKDTVVGIKDSSGDWTNLQSMLEAFPDFKIYPASEALLERALPLGAAGCISATANLQPRTIADYIDSEAGSTRNHLNEHLTAVRLRMQKTSMIPALKAVVGSFSNHSGWSVVRPPLVEVPQEEAKALLKDLQDLKFDMPGLADYDKQ